MNLQVVETILVGGLSGWEFTALTTGLVPTVSYETRRLPVCILASVWLLRHMLEDNPSIDGAHIP